MWHTKKVPLFEDRPERTVIISSEHYLREQAELLAYLRANEDVFAWSPNDLQGISRNPIKRCLIIDPRRLWPMSEERKAATHAEVQKLLEAKVIRLV